MTNGKKKQQKKLIHKRIASGWSKEGLQRWNDLCFDVADARESDERKALEKKFRDAEKACGGSSVITSNADDDPEDDVDSVSNMVVDGHNLNMMRRLRAARKKVCQGIKPAEGTFTSV